MKASHIYQGAYSLNAYIAIKGCDEAIEFYKKYKANLDPEWINGKLVLD